MIHTQLWNGSEYENKIFDAKGNFFEFNYDDEPPRFIDKNKYLIGSRGELGYYDKKLKPITDTDYYYLSRPGKDYCIGQKDNKYYKVWFNGRKAQEFDCQASWLFGALPTSGQLDFYGMYTEIKDEKRTLYNLNGKALLPLETMGNNTGYLDISRLKSGLLAEAINDGKYCYYWLTA